MKKVFLCLLIVLFLANRINPILGEITSIISHVHAADNESYGRYNEEAYADILKVMGLFKGTSKGYELDRTAKRVEVAVMLIRLLGEEKEVLSSDWSHPFTDVPLWADAYIGYLYTNDLTKGIGDNLFGTDLPATIDQYAAFVLRALEYHEKDGDFIYANVQDKIIELGLLNSATVQKIRADGVLTRGEMVLVSYQALLTVMNHTDDRLLDRLMDTGVVSLYCVNALGLVKAPDNIEINGDTYTVKDSVQLDVLLKWALLTMTDRLDLDTSAYEGNINEDTIRILRENDMYAGVYKSAYFKWYVSSNVKIGKFEIDIEYAMNKEEKVEVIKKACDILADILLADMSDYQKELVIHDYIVNHTVYGYSTHCYDAYGVLIQNEAVCQGYSRAMLLMSSLAGIYCIEVDGTDEDVSHSWNIVKLDGNYYHVDVAFDDPVGVEKVLRHYYFNVTDRDLLAYRVWDRDIYPECTAVDSNFYTKNNTFVNGINDVKNGIVTGYPNGKREYEYRLLNYNNENFTRDGMKEIINDISQQIKGGITRYSWTTYEKMKVVLITID